MFKLSKKTQKKSSGAGKFALGAAIGAIFGGAAGVLMAPKSGKETRKDIGESGEKIAKKSKKELAKLKKMAEKKTKNVAEKTKKVADKAVKTAKKK